MKNIYAYTDPNGSYPAYISVNEAGEGISVAVRSPRLADGSPGYLAQITLSPAEAAAISYSIRRWYDRRH